MSLRTSINAVLAGYLSAKEEKFAGHNLAKLIRGELCEGIRTASNSYYGLVIKGSSGQGNWADGPWAGLFNPIITESAQRGYYVCYLFREDMQGVYLSLNQGMTQAKEHYKADAKTALKARAQNYRAMLGSHTDRFSVMEIDLAPSQSSNPTAFYEAGNILATYYKASALPDEVQLTSDLASMLSAYEHLVSIETSEIDPTDTLGEAPSALSFEDATKFRIHKRIERNAKLVKQVKAQKGCKCEVCSVNFKDRYGPIGEGYIEAHHLKPIASLKGSRIQMDPQKDFAVLCANCHRMVHRSGLVDDIQRFKDEHYCG
ncbi:MrcB family domain-containing protein [Pseudomonas sp. RL_15y_Pfl2_60]|uniref:MrcB family domain-containing protein n=1 Tax=Pseudomonas sp. RL_15y_Pfl2_60 TaxID=3088709 RepID=UPI0030D80237